MAGAVSLASHRLSVEQHCDDDGGDYDQMSGEYDAGHRLSVDNYGGGGYDDDDGDPASFS